MDNEYKDKIKDKTLKDKQELIELTADYKISKKAVKRDIKSFGNILIAILSALIAILNVFFGCPCNLKIDECVLLAINLINIDVIAAICILRITDIICTFISAAKAGKDGSKRKGNVKDGNDNGLTDIIDIYYIDEKAEPPITELKNYYKKELENINKKRIKIFIILSVFTLLVAATNVVMVILGFAIK